MQNPYSVKPSNLNFLARNIQNKFGFYPSLAVTSSRLVYHSMVRRVINLKCYKRTRHSTISTHDCKTTENINVMSWQILKLSTSVLLLQSTSVPPGEHHVCSNPTGWDDNNCLCIPGYLFQNNETSKICSKKLYLPLLQKARDFRTFYSKLQKNELHEWIPSSPYFMHPSHLHAPQEKNLFSL